MKNILYSFRGAVQIPEQRGKGIGKMLIEYSINKARGFSKRYFRLYTSNDPNEAAAQHLYEKYGFMVIRKEKRLFYTKIFRELDLGDTKQ